MKEKLCQRIKEMTALIGISGNEWHVAEYVYNALKDHVDSIEVRSNGTVIAIKKVTRPGVRRRLRPTWTK